MCRSIEDGGRRCSRVGCRSAAELTERRRKAAARQRRYAAKKRAQGIIVSGSETAPENPFADFIPETITLTTEERDAEREHLADFFARKLADPTATWDAAHVVDDADENPFKDWVTGQPIP